MHKYQFYISFKDKIHTAASKAIQDCNHILASSGYQDFTVNTALTTDKRYLYGILKNILKLFFFVKPKSIIAVQYPLLSGNALFKYFIKALRIKKVKFFCIIHDLDELRYKEDLLIGKEAENLNYYDCIIVHNEIMQNWLLKRGVTTPMIPLQMFDYLTDKKDQDTCHLVPNQNYKKVVFAGNLTKSSFIYSLDILSDWCFNLYGPNFSHEKGDGIKNLHWNGSFSPAEIITRMEGAFGLIWDGEYIDRLDDKYGNYLKYNNPHKLSLYLAAGLPVIAPTDSAVSKFIREHNLGILVNNLLELKDMAIDDFQYNVFKTNVLAVSKRIKKGEYSTAAIRRAENILEVI
ncbi:MAG: hypothetical protein JWR67_2180 [Mucilaginibacter sp.]|nr:hypothetical protein [Mucilaginibacter sp.]